MNLGHWYRQRGALPSGLVLRKAAIHILTGKQHLCCLIESFVSLHRLRQEDQRGGRWGEWGRGGREVVHTGPGSVTNGVKNYMPPFTSLNPSFLTCHMRAIMSCLIAQDTFDGQK